MVRGALEDGVVGGAEFVDNIVTITS